MVKLAHDFLGHQIQQYPAGKYRSSLNLQREILGFKTLITQIKSQVRLTKRKSEESSKNIGHRHNRR
jgi:hypothetical protein